MTTDKPPWKNDNQYNIVQLQIQCNKCNYIDQLSFWLPDVIIITDYSIKTVCENCGESNWDVNQ